MPSGAGSSDRLPIASAFSGWSAFINSGLDRDLAHLCDGAAGWASLPVGGKIELLSACRAATGRTARRWTRLAAQAKGTTGTSIAGEEALTGPWALLSALNAYAATLTEIQRHGEAALDEQRVHRRPDGQLTVEVFPRNARDRFLQLGLRAEVWMQPGVTRANVRQSMGLWYRQTDPQPRVALVLGAGNVTSIGLLDVLYKLIAEGSACMLKVHPLLDYLRPVFEEAFAPLIEPGYIRLAFGGPDVGRYLCEHPLVDEIHVTGSTATYEAIQRENSGCKPITSELGNVSPAIVVPGGDRDWSDWELRYHAEQIATAKLHNAGFNCVALQVLICPANWKQQQAFRDAILRAFDRAPDRPAYYPGSAQRFEALVRHRTPIGRYGREGPEAIPRTIVFAEGEASDADALFQTEAFCPLLAFVTIPVDDIETYLATAVPFCNERLAGNLAANLIVDPDAARLYAGAVDDAIAGLRYGCIGVNVWSGAAFLLPTVPWGAFPGNTREHIGSGTGVVHNSKLFSGSQKSVLHAPFKPLVSQLKPPWFIGHRNQAKVAEALCDLEAGAPPYALAKIAALTLTG